MLKSAGIVRKVDTLGRIVLPMEIRRNMDINESDGLEIFIDEDKIILQKYSRGCSICKSMEDLVTVEGLTLCGDCIKKFNDSTSGQ